MNKQPPNSPIDLSANYPIEPHETWDIWDSSKIVEGMTCMRRMFFRYTLGLQTEHEGHDLIFGTCWHIAMDYLYRYGIDEENIDQAMCLFEEEYRKHFDEYTDLDFEPKIPSHARLALESYVKYRRGDKWEVMTVKEPCGECVGTGVYTDSDGIRDCASCNGSGEVTRTLIEVSGTVPISDKWRMSYRLDKVMTDKESNVIIRDHKTAKVDNEATRETWSSKMQPNLYGHALLCLVAEERYRGVELDITYFRKKDRDDGGVNRHSTIPVYRDKQLLEGWQWDTLSWLNQVEWNHEQLQKCKVDDPVMKAFPRNEKGCTAFFRKCPYYSICFTSNNPLQYAESTPIGFKKVWWNPMERVGDGHDNKVYHFESEKEVK